MLWIFSLSGFGAAGDSSLGTVDGRILGCEVSMSGCSRLWEWSF